MIIPERSGPIQIPISITLDREILTNLARVGKIRIQFLPRSEKKVILETLDYVGTFKLYERVIHIVPKIGFQNVFWLMSLNEKWKYDFSEDISHYQYQDAEIFSFLMEFFVSQCLNTIQKGMSKKYIQENEIGLPKGKIDFQKSLNKWIMYGKLAVITEYLDLNTLENQILATTLDIISGFGISKRNLKTWNQIQRFFAHVKRISLISPEVVDKVIFHSLNKHYRGVLKIAKILIQSGIIIQSYGEYSFTSFWIYMPEAFEQFIHYLLMEILQGSRLDSVIKINFKTRHSIGEQNERYQKIIIEPDYLVLDAIGRPKCVIDAKYKDIDTVGLKRNDLHQIMAYCYYFRTPGILIYPTRHNSDCFYYIKNGFKIFIIKIHVGWNSYTKFNNAITDEINFLEKKINEILI